jgi:hypothetical protein
MEPAAFHKFKDGGLRRIRHRQYQDANKHANMSTCSFIDYWPPQKIGTTIHNVGRRNEQAERTP